MLAIALDGGDAVGRARDGVRHEVKPTPAEDEPLSREHDNRFRGTACSARSARWQAGHDSLAAGMVVALRAVRLS
jgi:hypothetical protein